MGLLNKIFGKEGSPEGGESASSQFSETDPGAGPSDSRNAPRRELVQVVLRDVMRKHGIPSDWMDCRILSVVSRSRNAGLHITFIVKQGEDRLLHYVHAFQSSYMLELSRFEPRAADWVLSLSWQFEGKGSGAQDETWRVAPASGPAPISGDDELEEDLQALFAIRDAALRNTSEPAPLESPPDFEPTRPGDDMLPRR
jgi:hypothetical protein